MKKVIDAGALRSPQLEDFLTASFKNTAVLTDYASMESFKGDGAVNIRRSLEILRRFPRQVVILKSTAEIGRLRPRSAGLHSRLIDRKQTAGFPRYCSALFEDTADANHVTYDTDLKSATAQDHFRRIESKAAAMGAAWAALFKSYTPSDLKDLRGQ